MSDKKWYKNPKILLPLVAIIMAILSTQMVYFTIIPPSPVTNETHILPPEPSFYIKIEEGIEEDHFKIKATDASYLRPLPNVTAAVYEHGVERLLSGPQMTDETGCAIIEVSKGYNKYFDIVAEYKGERRTLTVDRGSWLIKVGDRLGPAGIAVFAIVVTSFIGVLGWLLRRHFEKSKKVK